MGVLGHGGGWGESKHGVGISLGIVGNVSSVRDLLRESLVPVGPAKHNVVANNKKDVQNTFFIGRIS